MKITNSEIKEQLKILWPNLTFIWLTDDLWELPKIEEVKEMVMLNSVSGMPYIRRQQACEEFALKLVCNIRCFRALTITAEQLNWPFGEVFGIKHNDKEEPHYWNICITDDGVCGIEPQTDFGWEMTAETDEVLMVKI